ncbi:MAG: glycosyltransferase family 4 protein, partial [Patescibacteria group bacterium]
LLKPHWFFSLWHLWRAVKKDKIKTVLVGQILPLGTVAWLLSRALGIKFDYVVFLHGMDLTYALKTPRKKELARAILTGAKKIIAANSYTAKLAEEIIDKNKIEVVNPGINASEQQIVNSEQKEYLIKKYSLAGKKVLLQVGRLVERKGYDKVLAALPEVLKECPDLIYVIIGNGPAISNIQYLISEYNIQNNILLITDVDDSELNSWYELCDIFIMPSRNMNGDFEGFGIVYLEANAHGKPVIAGDSGGVRDAVIDGVNGLLVDPESTDEIASAIIKLSKDESSRKKLGEQGKERAKQFDWKNQADKVREFIK